MVDNGLNGHFDKNVHSNANMQANCIVKTKNTICKLIFDGFHNRGILILIQYSIYKYNTLNTGTYCVTAQVLPENCLNFW